MTVTETETRSARPCVGCGRRTTLRWCSTSCHRADEPGAYEEEDGRD